MRLVGCLVLCLGLLATAGGCEHADPLSAGGVEPTLRSIQANIFDTNCALSGCHGGAGVQVGLDLSAGRAYANLVNVRSVEVGRLFRVAPGQPDSSYLFLKITGAPGIFGERMPRGRPALSAEQIDAVRQWIAAGALDN